MVWSTERRAVQQRPVGKGTRGGRVNAGHREGLARSERREQTGHALGQHRLARPRWPDHEEVMAPCGGNLDGSTTEGLAPHVGEVGWNRGITGRGRSRRNRPTRLAAKDGHQLSQRCRSPHLRTADKRRLPDVAERNNKTEWGGRFGEGDHARNMAQRPIESEFAAEGETFGGVGRQLASGDE